MVSGLLSINDPAPGDVLFDTRASSKPEIRYQSVIAL